MTDTKGKVVGINGNMVSVEFDGNILRQARGKPKFIELLEQVKLVTVASA